MVFSRLSKAAVQVDNREPEQISMRQMTNDFRGFVWTLYATENPFGNPASTTN